MKLYGTSAAHSTGGSQLVTQHATFNTKNTAKLNAIKMVKMFASTLKSTSRSLTLLALILFTGAAHAAKDPIYTPLLNNRAVGGYDVHDGKLFLNINQDIKQTWLGDKLNYIEKADKNWPDLLN